MHPLLRGKTIKDSELSELQEWYVQATIDAESNSPYELKNHKYDLFTVVLFDWSLKMFRNILLIAFMTVFSSSLADAGGSLVYESLCGIQRVSAVHTYTNMSTDSLVNKHRMFSNEGVVTATTCIVPDGERHGETIYRFAIVFENVGGENVGYIYSHE